MLLPPFRGFGFAPSSLAVVLLLVAVLIPPCARATPMIGEATGSWVNPAGGPTLVTQIVNGPTSSTFTHGETRLDMGDGMMMEFGVSNVLTYMGSSFSNATTTLPIVLGTLQMRNGSTFNDSEATGVTLRVSLALQGLAQPAVMDLPLSLVTTENSSNQLDSADIVKMTSPTPIIQGPDGSFYKVTCSWVSQNSALGVVSSNWTQVQVFEGATAPVQLWGTMTAVSQPVFTTQPADTFGIFGSQVQLTAVAANADSYQWYKGQAGDTTAPVAGAASPALAFMHTGEGSYWVRATNAAGSSDSRTAVVTMDEVRLVGGRTIGWNGMGLAANAEEAPGVTFEWYRDGVRVPALTSSRIYYWEDSFPLGDAGLYTVVVAADNVRITTNSMPLNFVARIFNPIETWEGATLVVPTASAGPSMTYQWAIASGPLPENAHFQGTKTSTLTISGVRGVDQGDYNCTVSNGFDSAVVSYSIKVRGKPVVKLYPGSDWQAGMPVEAAFMGTEIEGEGLVISASGLPPGIGYDRYSGALSGRPLRAGTFTIKMRGRNRYGLGPLTTQSITVAPLDSNRIGTFHGLVEHDSAINNGLGGRFTLTTTANATFTGVVTSGSVSRSFTGSLLRQLAYGAYELVSGTVQWPASRGAPARTLSFTLGDNTILTGELRSGEAHANLRAIRSPWSPLGVRAVYHTGAYALALPLDSALEGDNTYPQGTGCILGSINLSGVFTTSARLADNSVVTASTIVCQDGSIPFHYLLYGGTGSVHGWSSTDSQELSGNLTWIKHAQAAKSKTRSYKSGFPAHGLSIAGGRRRMYMSDEIVMGLPDQPGNAQFTLSLTGEAGDLTQSFQVTGSNAAQMQAGSPLKLSISSDRAKFTGTVSYEGLKGPCHGCFIDQLGIGAGSIQLPETTAAGSPVMSRKITLSPAPGFESGVVIQPFLAVMRSIKK